jgi:acylpyruvate hydrolase
MRFASVLHDGRPLAVAIDGERAIPLRDVTELGAATPSQVLSDPPLDEAAAVPVSELTFRAVVPNPAKVICIGLNYAAHIEETGNTQGEYPVLFPKWASTLTGPFADIVRDPEPESVDYETELAVIIGTAGRRIAPEAVYDHVAGFTVANDLSMRDYQYKTKQYLQGKAWDATTPLGPYLVTRDEVGDPKTQPRRLTTVVNGDTLQDSTTELMIWDIPALISTVSEFMALAPGDVILTGTPSGVGFRREPPVLLDDGDVLVSEVEGVGRMENRIVRAR